MGEQLISDSKMALEGIRVIDWTQFAAGAATSNLLGALGAEVIHVEALSVGDGGRGVIRLYGVNCVLEGSRTVTFENWNRNKKSLAINLKHETGRQILYELVKKSDVFVTSFLENRVREFKLDYETLCQYNPRIIYGEVNLYGCRGPDCGGPGWDSLGQARSGIMTCIGESRETPMYITGAPADMVSAAALGYGIVVALLARERLGISQKISVSQLGAMIAIAEGTSLGVYLLTGKEPNLHVRNETSNPLDNLYKCKDGRWICLCAYQETYFPRVAKMIGIPELFEDPRFTDMHKREQNNKELISILDSVFIKKTASEWQEIAKKETVPLSIVNRLSDLAADPQVLANDYIIEADHPIYGRHRFPGYPFELSKTPAKLRSFAPECGQHTEEILTEICGYSWDKIEKFRNEGVI